MRGGGIVQSSGGAGGEEVRTREPTVSVRDPIVQSRPAPNVDGVMLVNGNLTSCPKCGKTIRKWFVDRYSFETGKMERPKYCGSCNHKFILLQPPTEAEKKANRNQVK